MYDRLYDMINCEIDKIENKGELNVASLDNLDKLVDIIKDLQTIDAMSYAEERDYGFSNGGYSNRNRMMYNNDGGYSNGRYYRGRNMNYGYSYGDGGRGEMINHLEQAMAQASSEEERNEIRQMIDKMNRR